MQKHHDVHFKLHFEVGGFQGGAGEEPGEHHVDGDGEAPADVAVGDLDVLDLGGVPGVALGTPTGLHTHELQLDALDGRLGALHHQLPRQRLRDHTVGGVQVPSDQEFGKGGSLFNILQSFRSNGEVHRARQQLPFL